MTDSGVFCNLLEIKTSKELLASKSKAEVIETFVYTELLKHLSYSLTQAQIYHYRTNDKKRDRFYY